MILAHSLVLFAFGATLLFGGNRLRGVSAPEARTLWIKYFTYAGIVGGMLLCSLSHASLVLVLPTLGVVCVCEVVRIRKPWAALWVAVSVWLALTVQNFGPMYLVVAAADGFAEVGGRLLRGPRPWPNLSPTKTLSGALSGIAVAATLAERLGIGMQIGIALALAGLLGDLLASQLKRAAGAKDFGQSIPGHGGFMDRFDSLWGAALVGAFLC